MEVIREAGGCRVFPEVEQNGFLVHAEGKEMLNFSSNDYLGLSTNPRLIEEFRAETDVMALSYSAASSRLFSGNHQYYQMLESDLADWYEKEAALVFNSGYHAATGILPALGGKRDLILADRLVYPGLVDGLRLSEATVLFYRHADYEHLRELLERSREEYENVFVATESVFGMEGDVADLQQLCDLKKEFDAFLYVDEAHAIGVRGTNGLGCCEEQACIEDVDFIVGTFGEAFASLGAFVVCEGVFRDYLVNMQRSLVFTAALPPVNVAWTRFILNRMPDFYELRLKLSGFSRQLREALVAGGFETRGSSHVVPLICGSNEDSAEMSALLQDNGFFVLPVRYPMLPRHEARLRFSLNASIPPEDYECLFEFLKCIE